MECAERLLQSNPRERTQSCPLAERKFCSPPPTLEHSFCRRKSRLYRPSAPFHLLTNRYLCWGERGGDGEDGHLARGQDSARSLGEIVATVRRAACCPYYPFSLFYLFKRQIFLRRELYDLQRHLAFWFALWILLHSFIFNPKRACATISTRYSALIASCGDELQSQAGRCKHSHVQGVGGKAEGGSLQSQAGRCKHSHIIYGLLGILLLISFNARRADASIHTMLCPATTYKKSVLQCQAGRCKHSHSCRASIAPEAALDKHFREAVFGGLFLGLYGRAFRVVDALRQLGEAFEGRSSAALPHAMRNEMYS